jgi:preprotein translocase subunit YajC
MIWHGLLAGVVAQAQDGQQEAGALGTFFQLIPLLLMFGVFYFILIRPANKQKREHQNLLNALKKDDQIVTTGGIYGKVVAIEEKVATIEIADKVKIKIMRDRIAGRPGTDEKNK